MRRIVNRQYLFGVLFSTVFFIGLITNFIVYRNSIVEEHERYVVESIAHLKTLISIDIDQKKNVLRDLASVIAVSDLSDAETLGLLQRTMANEPDFFSIYLGYPDNRMINGSGFDPYLANPEYDVRLRPWYVEAVAQQSQIITAPFVNSSNDYVIMVIAQPLYNAQDELIGVIGGDLIVNNVFSIIKEAKMTSSSYSFLIDEEGDFLAHPIFPYTYNADLNPPIQSTNFNSISWISHQNLFTGENGIKKVSLNNELGFIVYNTIPQNEWTLGTFIPEAEYNHYVEHLYSTFIYTIAGMLIVTFFFFLWQRKHLTKPMVKIESDVARIDLNEDIGFRLPKSKKDPFGGVRDKVNLLLMKTEEFYHSLQTQNQTLQGSNEVLEKTVGLLRKTEEELRIQYQKVSENEVKYKSLVTTMSQGLLLFEGIFDEMQNLYDLRLLEMNDSFGRMARLRKEEAIGKAFSTLFPQHATSWLKRFERVLLTGESHRLEETISEFKGTFEVLMYRSRENQIALIFMDISMRKRLEEKLTDLSFKDQLTGIWNRRFYEEELKRLEVNTPLPLTILMSDVNGLKLINDSFGHDEGDRLLKKVAQLIVKNSPKHATVCRIGGDEFIVLIPRFDYFETDELVKRMKKVLSKEKVSGVEISISFGWATRDYPSVHLEEIIKRAEDNMYKNKLYESPSMRSKTIQTILGTLFKKNQREESHSKNVSLLLEKFAQALNFSDEKTKELGNAGLLHDIGKIIIDEKILEKPGKLTDLEMIEIKRHPEIGYRILSTVKELSDLSEIILAHHERWDGNGYPKGLIKDKIPYEARMMTIADAFDAMTNERPFRKAMDEEWAIAELRRHAGTQFDPFLVEEFIRKVLRK